MTWLLLITKRDEEGNWQVVGGPHRTKQATEAEGERLRSEDPSIMAYAVEEDR